MAFLETVHQKKSAAITTVLALLLLCLLFLMGLNYYDPPIEYGMEVNFGMSTQGSGKTAVSPPESQPQTPSEPSPESPTPPGDYSITRKEAKPVYHKHGKVIAPGPKNPVGVRYMAYFTLGSGEYAIHGTAWPNWVKLRAAVSLGCIRMLNSDVVKVFNMVDVGTPVVVKAN